MYSTEGRKRIGKEKHCKEFQLSTGLIGQEMDKTRDTFETQVLIENIYYRGRI